MFATGDFSRIASCDAVPIAVPTPLNKNREPDLSSSVWTCQSIAPFVREKQLIVLESTTYPGTTDEVVVPILENIFRAVNIALVNELKLAFMKMGLDVWEIIEAASTKPFGCMPFYPGLGGHCIPIDPFYLTWKAREYGAETRFIELAGEINAAMPDFVVQRVMEALNYVGKPLRAARILFLGFALQSKRG